MLAFTFPGQGSQKPGMGSAWVDHPSWELVDEASDACGRDVAALLLHADADELRHTRNSQLSTFVLSMVVLDAVERTGLLPDRAAGHSLGEYSALCATGALAYDDAVRPVAERGEAMQIAAEEFANLRFRSSPTLTPKAARRPTNGKAFWPPSSAHRSSGVKRCTHCATRASTRSSNSAQELPSPAWPNARTRAPARSR